MIKQITLLLLSTSAFAVEEHKPTITTEKVDLLGGLGVAAVGTVVIAAPATLSIGAFEMIKECRSKCSKHYCICLGISSGYYPSKHKLSAVRVAAKTTRPYVLPNEQEKCAANMEEEIKKTEEAKRAFVSCMLKNKFHRDKDNHGRPLICQEVARTFGMMVGRKQLDKTSNSTIH